MKKRIFSFLFAVFFCMILTVPMFAEENRKADFGFSLSGGNQDGKTSWMGEFYLAQDWRLGRKESKMRNLAFLVQGTGMAYVYDRKKPWDNGEYGASAGLGPEWYFSDSTKVGAFVFVDALGKNRFWFAHARPTVMISLSRFKLLGGAAFHLTKSMIVSEIVSDPIFWYDQRGYGYDTIYQRLIAETIDYAFIRGEFVLKPFRWLDLDFAGEYNQGLDQYKDIHRLELGGKIGLLKGIIAIGARYFKTQAENVWSKWFDQNGWRFEISFNPFLKQSFSDLVQRKFVDVFWPVVVVKEDNKTVPTKISEVLKYILRLSKKIFCINEEVKIIGEISGTPPFDVHFDWGDGTEPLDFQTPDKLFPFYHKYAKAGHYCINSWVMDKWGHKIEQCECIDVEDCNKPCVPARIVYFKPDKYSIKQGESITITGKVKNATSSILNGGEFNDKVEQDNPFTEIATPSKTTTYELKALNDCPSEDTAHFTVLVDECKEIVLKDNDFQVSPLSVKVNEKVTVTVAMAENAAELIATKDGVSFATEPGIYEFSFSEAGTHEFKVVYKNDCSSAESSKTVTVTKPCVMCDEQEGVTFHVDGSFALDRNNFPEGQNIEFDFQVYNKSDCAFGVPIKYDVRYQDGGQEKLTFGSQNIGTVPAHTVWNMKFKYTWNTKTVTLIFVSSSPFFTGFEPIVQCPVRKVKVKLSIGNCGPL